MDLAVFRTKPCKIATTVRNPTKTKSILIRPEAFYYRRRRLGEHHGWLFPASFCLQKNKKNKKTHQMVGFGEPRRRSNF